jgi:hypothetical protein
MNYVQKYPGPEWSLRSVPEGSIIGAVLKKYVRKTKEPASATDEIIFIRQR